MDERWMRESINSLLSAIEKFNRGKEGDFKQALIIADQASEIIMRNYLIFKEKINPPRNYHFLLKKVDEKVNIPSDVTETIKLFRLIRDGFQHYNLKNIDEALESTTTGLTLEKSFLEDYLNAVCSLFKFLTNIQIDIRGDQNAETD